MVATSLNFGSMYTSAADTIRGLGSAVQSAPGKINSAMVGGLDTLEKIKHSTTLTEHTCKLFQEACRLSNVQTEWSKKMLSHSDGLVHFIDAAQWIFPIHYFFVPVEDQNGSYYEYQKEGRAHNVFMVAHLFVSAFDFYEFLEGSRVLELGKFAADVARDFPVLQLLGEIPSGSLIKAGVVCMFTASAVHNLSKLSGNDLKETDVKKAALSTAYAVGTVAVTLLESVTTESTSALRFVVQGVGLAGTMYGAYNP